MKVAVDVPDELIVLAGNIDFEKIPKGQYQKWLGDLESIGRKYIPLKKNSQNFREIKLPGVPQKVFDIINKHDFSGITGWKKKIAMPFIKKFLTNNVPLKNKL